MNGIEREFNDTAPVYETNRLAPWYKAHADLILRECRPARNGDVLDVGCGTGYLLRAYLGKHPGSRGVGIDIAAQMVREARGYAKEAGLNDVEFIHADWETFELSRLTDYSFTTAFCVNTFHYFSAPAEAARKLADIMAPDGTLYVWERNKANSLLTRFWGWLHRYYIKDNVEFYTDLELENIFRDAGFREVAHLVSVNRLFWKRKLYTSATLVKCTR